ncbi:hypothetical protein HK405_009590, partial [Cladochytrium tenue]
MTVTPPPPPPLPQAAAATTSTPPPPAPASGSGATTTATASAPQPGKGGTSSSSAVGAAVAAASAYTAGQRQRRGRVPLWVLVAAYMAASTVAVGLIGWLITLSAGRTAVASLDLQLQGRLASEVASDAIGAINVAVQTAGYLQVLFQTGKLSMQESNRTSTVQIMKLIYTLSAPWLTRIYSISYPDGAMYSWESDADKFLLTELSNQTRTVYACSQDGTDCVVESSEADTTNATTIFEPYLTVDYSNSSFASFGLASPSDDGTAHRVAAAVAVNNVTEANTTVLVAVEQSLMVVDEQLAPITAALPYSLFVVVIEPTTGRLLAVSDSSVSVLSAD